MEMTRRGFLKGMAGILAAGVAPAVIGSNILMPVKKLWTPPPAPLPQIFVTGNPIGDSWVKVWYTMQEDGPLMHSRLIMPTEFYEGDSATIKMPQGSSIVRLQVETNVLGHRES